MDQGVKEKYQALLVEFTHVTAARKATPTGEFHNELTRRRNTLRSQMQQLKAEFPDQIVPNDDLASEVIDERTNVVEESSHAATNT